MNRLMRHIYRRTFKRLFPDTGEIIEALLRSELQDCRSVLDLGCGPSSPLKKLKNDPVLPLYSVGVDIFKPYILKNLAQEKIHSEYLNKNIFEIDFPPDSFDCALLIDVIEHMHREEFLNFLPRLEKIVKKIIIITPNGFIPQSAYDSNSYQQHRSGWTVQDFLSLGFTCRGLSGYKALRVEEWRPKIKPSWLGEAISNMTQPFVSRRANLAYHIIAVKKRQEDYD